jgi:hypothetical protein
VAGRELEPAATGLGFGAAGLCCSGSGAELVKEVAKKTDDVAGDGTTTATVLACSFPSFS